MDQSGRLAARTARIVGIDPGTARTGYACVEEHGGVVRLIRAETIALAKGRSAPERLGRLAKAVEARLASDRPDAVAVERLYFTKNQKTAMAVAEARGVILLTAHRHVNSILEYGPMEVKLAVAGYGGADKGAVRRSVRMLIGQGELPAGDDAIDAVAIALTALAMRNAPRKR